MERYAVKTTLYQAFALLIMIYVASVALIPESVNVFHTVTTTRSAQGVLDRIDPIFFNPKSRFGEAFYVSEIPDTTLAELSHHGLTGVDTLRFAFNSKSAEILDLSNPAVAKAWGYKGGEVTPFTQSLGSQAKAAGFNVVRYSSERGFGSNLAILNDFNKLLEPKMVVPTPRVYSPSF
ncbi:hypothetical protein BH10PSE19_BH10PSE19_09650 [soil metagenome]